MGRQEIFKMKRIFLFIAFSTYFAKAACPRSCSLAWTGSPWRDTSGYANGLNSHYQVRCTKTVGEDVSQNAYDIYPSSRTQLRAEYLEDEWEISQEYFLYAPPEETQQLMRLSYILPQTGWSTLFRIYGSRRFYTIECFSCDDSFPHEFQQYVKYNEWFKLRVKQVRLFSHENTLAEGSYHNGSLYLELWYNDYLMARIRQKDSLYSDRVSYQYNLEVGPFSPPKIYNPWEGYVPDMTRVAMIRELKVEATRFETCDECSAGDHGCVQNALCYSDKNSYFISENSSDTTCLCVSGFVGDGKKECRSCNNNYNCMRMRIGCSGSWPVNWNQSNLVECLSGASNDLQLQNIVHKRKTINGVRSNQTISFFKSENQFVFFDPQYQIWRIGGKMAQTVDADCSSLDIC